MKIIGITGGIGSGKSLILDYIKKNFSACVIQADEIGHRLMETGGAAYKKMVQTYGPEILCSDGTISKAMVAQIGFVDEEAVNKLNSLTHPLILKEIQRQITEAEESGRYQYLFYEAALPGEAKMQEICKEIWYIYAPKEVRIARLIASRGYSEEKCQTIIQRQMMETEFIEIADHVIENGEDFQNTKKQIRQLLTGICKS